MLAPLRALWCSPARPLALIPLLGLVLIAGLWWAVLSRLDSEQTGIVAGAVQDSERHVAAYEERMLRAIRDMDRTALLVKYEYERERHVNLRGLAELGLIPSDALILVSLADSRGIVVDASIDLDVPISVDDRSYFAIHAGRDTGNLFISEPMIDRVSGKHAIVMTRRLNRPDGTFAGIVAITVDPRYFTDFYQESVLGRGGVLAVVGTDGLYRARRVGDKIETGVDARGTPLFARAMATPVGSFVGASAIDGVVRMLAFRRMREYPLILAAAQSQAEVLAGFASRRRETLLSTALATLAIAACFGAVALLFYRARRSQRRAEDAGMLFRAAADGGLDAFCLLRSVRRDGRIVDFAIHEANPRAAELIGVPRERLLGKRLHRILDRIGIPHLLSEYIRVAETGEPLEQELEVHPQVGPGRWLRHQVVRARDGIAITARDITGQRKDQEQLRTKTAFLQALVDHLPLGVVVRSARPDSMGRVELWNHACSYMYGLPEKDVMGRTFAEVLPADVADRAELWDRRLLESPMVQVVPSERTELPSRGVRYLRYVRAPIFDDDDRVGSIITIATDVTDEKTRQDELRLASKVFETTADAVLLSDAADNVIMVNQAFVDMTGFTADEVRGKPVTSLPFAAGHLARDASFVSRLYQEGRLSEELTLRRKDGAELSTWATATCVLDEHGRIANHVRVFSDISELKSSQRQLEQLANYDPLTGLPNRRLFQDRLELALHRARRSGAGAALLFIDLDGFKEVNDSIGHDVGDLLLAEVARRLLASVRAADSVCRLGGDEFTVIVEDATLPVDALAVCERILESLAAPFNIAGHPLTSGASIGVALFPDHGADPTTLLRNADVAMYRAKKAGRNRYAIAEAEAVASTIESGDAARTARSLLASS